MFQRRCDTQWASTARPQMQAITKVSRRFEVWQHGGIPMGQVAPDLHPSTSLSYLWHFIATPLLRNKVAVHGSLQFLPSGQWICMGSKVVGTLSLTRSSLQQLIILRREKYTLTTMLNWLSPIIWTASRLEYTSESRANYQWNVLAVAMRAAEEFIESSCQVQTHERGHLQWVMWWVLKVYQCFKITVQK